jgi:hypothetical protein
VLLELTNPDVEIQTLNADRQLTDAQSQLVQLKANLNSSRLTQASSVADLKSQWQDAKRRAESGAELLKQGLIIPLDQKQAQDRADALENRVKFEEERLKIMTQTVDEQVDRLRSISAFQHGLKASMVVRAGATGVLQEIPLEVGQYAQAGATLAKVVPTPLRLKAVLRIPETQAKDLSIGQKASIDTRNGIAAGHVIRIDPASINGTVTVDVALDGTPPAGARPDLSVDGVIEIARMKDVLLRPARCDDRDLQAGRGRPVCAAGLGPARPDVGEQRRNQGWACPRRRGDPVGYVAVGQCRPSAYQIAP